MPLIEFDAQDSAIDGLKINTIKQVSDERGTVREFFRLSTYAPALADTSGGFAQINVTFTRRGAIRGLHGEAMTKLVAVASGEAFGAYVDARRHSPSFGAVVTTTLRPGTQVLVPRGVLNGFQSTGDDGSEYLYCFDVEWQPDMPGIGVHPLDPELAISWPIEIDVDDRTLLSAKDGALPRFSELHLG